MLNILFTPNAWEDIQELEKEDKKLYQKAKKMITESARDPFNRSGKAEKLKGKNFEGCYSKRIDKKHRIIYKFNEGELIILACFGHYD
ncbi:Txe/YoeB family addiction module toxin [Cetobacterium sp.]|uniref:Txe/YoeB family addiction module toxin n=1 Tax=Cetobacterium sp. TaxID=2071632 RepID=UPI003F36425E